MKIKLAIEWFLNPDHLPLIIAKREGIFEKHGIDFELIEPTEHYDGLEELLKGNIEFATNEPLHLIEQFDDNMLSLGTYFETKGGVLMKRESYDKLANGENITVTTPVSNETTNAIGFEIIRRYYANNGVEVTREQVEFVPNGFEHLKFMKEGADAGWLYFYNFEGIEAQHEGMDVIYMDAKNTGFANFSALDIFTNKAFYNDNPETVQNFIAAVKEATRFMNDNPEKAMAHYYAYTSETSSPLMDDILKATMPCFSADFDSEFQKSLPILEFFREIGITSLENDRFKTAFLN
jgi:ABC-type nitrate/sulfonate/bicarbonate transport system substrate-binding protein